MSNNKSYSTNRFLSKTNPQFIRGLADSGSVLNSPEINKLAAQMVDLGIYDSCKLWVYNGLAKERVSSPDVFAEKGYDLSGNNNDAVQSTTANQPKIISTGFDFDGSNDRLIVTGIPTNGTDNASVLFWWKVSSFVNSTWFFGDDTNPNLQSFFDSVGGLFIRVLNKGIPTLTNISGYSIDTWYFTVGTYSSSGNESKAYINGILINTSNNPRTLLNNVGILGIGYNNNSNGGFINATINDLRYFDSALTADQIDAIFNETKGYYGL